MGSFTGVYAATVFNNNDPKLQNRVQLKIPQVLGQAVSAWATPLALVQPVTTPAVGSSVLAMFVGGEVSHPVYALQTQSPLLFSSYSGQVNQDGPAAWWMLNDPQNAVAVQDSSGNNFGGTAANVVFQQLAGITGVPSALFNGFSSSIITTYTPPSLNAFTVEIWVNQDGFTQLTTFPQIISNSNTSGTNKGFQLYVPVASPQIPVINLGNGTSWTGFSFNQALPATGWTHLAATFDGTKVTCYFNGATASQTPWTGPVAADSAVNIGTNIGNNANQYTGLLSEAAIYTTALPYSRILAHYQAKTQGVQGTNIAAGTVVAGIVDGTTITGAQIVADGSQGQFLAYSGAPNANNLITAISGMAGVDKQGNPYIGGVQVGANNNSQVMLAPDAATYVGLPTNIGGTIQSALQLITNDTNEKLPGDIGSVILGSGAAAKMSTAVTSPLTGTSTGMAILLESQNDGGTDNPLILLGSVVIGDPPSNTTLVFTPVAAFSPYTFLLYSGAQTITVVTKTSGSGTIPVPANANGVAKAEAWGSGAGGGVATSSGAGSAGGGAYSQEPLMVVTPGGSVSYSVGAPGLGGIWNGAASTDGAASTIGVVTANGGHKGTVRTHGAGGAISGNTISFPGGDGADDASNSITGSGGGSSAGPGGAGRKGSPGGPNGGLQGGAGGVAPAGGGSGGPGGGAILSGLPGTAGSSPGGGGGGGAEQANAGNGGKGQVRITFTSGNPTILLSISTTGGTDQFGTTYQAGFHFSELNGSTSGAPPVIKYLTADAGQCTSQGQTAVLTANVNAGSTYWFEAELYVSSQSSNLIYLTMGGTATVTNFSAQIIYEQVNTTAAGDALNWTVVQTTLGNNSGLSTRATVNTQLYIVRIRGFIVVNAAGTLTVNQASSLNAASFTVKKNSQLKLYLQ